MILGCGAQLSAASPAAAAVALVPARLWSPVLFPLSLCVCMKLPPSPPVCA